MPFDPENLILLDNLNWENHIPKRLIFYEELQMEDDEQFIGREWQATRIRH
jgi:hypothetical protein